MRQRATGPCRTSLLVAVAMGITLLAAPGAFARILVDVNGQPVHFTGVQPTRIGGRVFIPLRAVAEALGASIRWDAGTRTVYGSRADRHFTLPLGARVASVQGQPVRLDAPARVMAGTTMVPLRFVAEALGAQVDWNDEAQRVAILLEGDAGVGGFRQDERFTENYRDDRGQMVIPRDTVVRVKLEEKLSSRTARVGQRFMVRVAEDDRSRFPVGTRFEGEVVEVENATRDRPGVLDMAFRRAILPDGTVVPISGSLASLDRDSVRQTADGRLEARSDRRAKFDFKWVGIGAGAGAALSAIFGGNILKGALIGAAGGAVYGYLDKQKRNRRFHEVELAAGTEFGVRLNDRVAFADNPTYRY